MRQMRRPDCGVPAGSAAVCHAVHSMSGADGEAVRPILFYLLALIIVASDQISKWAVTSTIRQGESVQVIPHVLWLSHTWNTGGAFSLFQAKNGVFIAIAL